LDLLGDNLEFLQYAPEMTESTLEQPLRDITNLLQKPTTTY